MTITTRYNPLTGAKVEYHETLAKAFESISRRFEFASDVNWRISYFRNGKSYYYNNDKNDIGEYKDKVAEISQLIQNLIANTTASYNFFVEISYPNSATNMQIELTNNYRKEQNGQKLARYRVVYQRCNITFRHEVWKNLREQIGEGNVGSLKNTSGKWKAILRVYLKAHLRLFSRDKSYWIKHYGDIFTPVSHICSGLVGLPRWEDISKDIPNYQSDPMSTIMYINLRFGPLKYDAATGFYFEQEKPWTIWMTDPESIRYLIIASGVRTDKEVMESLKLMYFNPLQEPYETSYDHIQKRIDYGSLVRNNIMYREGYTPYCGAQARCFYNWPRMTFDGKQFKCRCGFVTQHHPEFIAEYKAKWGLK